jgi:WhiB family transcriptional regulator, redox-sensing transcriptional regulator
MSWRNDAACRDADPTLFHAKEHAGGRNPYSKARRVCATCTVTVECLEFVMGVERGLSHTWRFGFWAGFTPVERERLGLGKRVA